MSHHSAHAHDHANSAGHNPSGHSHDAHADAHHGPHVHVMSLTMLFSIFAALIVFTLVTVIVSQFHLGAWEVPIAMAIATTKAILVAVYFMHLRYDNPFNALIFSFSLLFVGLFLGVTLLDAKAYQKDLMPPPVNTPAAPQ